MAHLRFTVLIEQAAPPPPPPPPSPPSPPYVILNTMRAYLGADTSITAWVRDERGRHDLAQYGGIEIEIKRGAGRVLSVRATGTDKGRLSFEVTASAVQRIGVGHFTVRAIADGQVVCVGTLEVV